MIDKNIFINYSLKVFSLLAKSVKIMANKTRSEIVENNSFNALDLFDDAYLGKKSVGGKNNIYKKDSFNYMLSKNYPNLLESEREDAIKKTRKKLRKLLLVALQNFVNANNKEKEALNFHSYYCAMYNVNDYSVQSVCGANISDETKDYVAKVLPEIKKYIDK